MIAQAVRAERDPLEMQKKRIIDAGIKTAVEMKARPVPASV